MDEPELEAGTTRGDRRGKRPPRRGDERGHRHAVRVLYSRRREVTGDLKANCRILVSRAVPTGR